MNDQNDQVNELLEQLSSAQMRIEKLEKEKVGPSAHDTAVGDRYRTLFETASDAIFSMRGDTFVDCNERTVTLFGCDSKSDIIGHSPWEFSPETQPDGQNSSGRAKELIGAALRGQPQSFLWKHRKKDGTLFDAEVSLNAFQDQVETLLLAVVRDVTERIRAEEYLRLSEEKFAKAFRSSPDSITISRLSDGTFVDVNTGFESLTGMHREDVIGRSAVDIGMWNSPADREDLKVALETKGYVRDFELTFDNPAGEPRDCLLSADLIEFDGEKCLVTTVRDVTEKRRAEKALRESEVKYRSLVANIPDMLWTADDDANILFVSANVHRLLGYAADEVYRDGKKITRGRVYQDDLETVARSYAALVNSGEPFDVEYRFQRKDDSWIWLHDRAVVTRSEQGELRVDGIISDISDRKRAEFALLESESRFSRAFHGSAALMSISSATDGRIYEVNDAVLNTVGYERGEVIGKTPAEISLWADPEQQEGIRDAIQREGQITPVEVAFRTKDGQIRCVVYTLDVIRWKNEQCYLATGVDITENKNIREALRASEERFLNLAQTIPSVIYRCRLDEHWTMLFLSDYIEEIAGYPASDFIDNRVRSFASLIHEDDVESVERAVNKAVAERGQWALRYRILHKDGSIRWFHERGRAIYNNSGDVEYLDGFCIDITDRKRAEEELQQARALLEAAIEQSPAGILIAEAPDVNIRLANTAALGIRAAEAETVTQIPAELHPEQWQVYRPDGSLFKPEELPLSRAVLEGATSKNVDAIIRRNDGTERWVLANAAPVRDENGEVVAGVVVFPDITEVKRAESMLRALVKATSTTTGQDFFSSLVRHIAEGLECSYAYVGRLIDSEQPSIETLAFWSKTGILDNFQYKLDGTPCETVVGKTICVYQDKVQETFPDDLGLQRMGIASYIGKPIFRSDGSPMGLLVIMDDKPLPEEIVGYAQSLMSVSAARASAELERMQADSNLQQANRELQAEHDAITEKNIALREILTHMEQEKDTYRQELCENVEQLFTPTIDKLESEGGQLTERDMALLKSGLRSIVDKDIDQFRQLYASLSPREMEICEMIREGRTSKDIADSLMISLPTVHKHREKIRKKLRVQNRDVNLSAYLRYKK